MLTAQYKKNRIIGPLALRIFITRWFRLIATRIATSNNAVYTRRSTGLPSITCSAESMGAIPSHVAAGREQARPSQTIGIQSAIEVRAFGSRSSQNSPRIPTVQIVAAIDGGILLAAQGHV